MKLGIMQPYFFPYVGYFQLIAAVDVFVVYDNIKYTKKGWINRNRMLQNDKDVTFSLYLKSDSDYLNICQRELSADFNRAKLTSQFKDAYRRAPYFEQTFQLVEQVVYGEQMNLFDFLHRSIVKTCEHLNIQTTIKVSSDITIDHNLRGQDKVLAICSALGATTYINAIGGRELYSEEAFRERSIDLQFIQPRPFEYPQFGALFVPWLSIVDVLMFNSLEHVTMRICNDFDFR
jgi:hypothetical protein